MFRYTNRRQQAGLCVCSVLYAAHTRMEFTSWDLLGSGVQSMFCKYKETLYCRAQVKGTILSFPACFEVFHLLW